ncbi:hypothetical protein B296_00028011 [Ensete ventricosum]|uniref:Uncharacterized protein n=1 Tax=Ensete ventricosum TaxID=4639 RepID=A0A427AMT5_ENSVE|nr:hypothetical protein B296_00028011 [Ensete ventricosum]
MVVKLPSTYNVIIGRLTLDKLRAGVSTYHQSMKFPTSAGVGEAKSDPRKSRHYLVATIIPKKAKKEASVLDPREPDKLESQPKPTKQVLEVPLDPEFNDARVHLGGTSLDTPRRWIDERDKRRSRVGLERPLRYVGKPTAGRPYIPVFHIRMEKMKEVKRPPL